MIEQVKTDILWQIAENKGENISKEQLKNILNTYFIENEVTELVIPDDTSTSNAKLTSKEGSYKIKLSDIYSGIFNSTGVNKPVEQEGIYVTWCYNDALVFSNNQKDIDTYVLENKTTVFNSFGNIKDNYYDLDNLPAWAGDGGVSKVVFLNPIAPQSTAYWFCDLEGDTIENINYLNTSNVTNMSGMFDNAYRLTSLDLRGFDTSKVTKFDNMFSSVYARVIIGTNWKSAMTESATGYNGTFEVNNN